LILNIVYSPDEAHKSTQLVHQLISKVFQESGIPITECYLVKSECSDSINGDSPAITTSDKTKKKGVWKYIPTGLSRKLSRLVKTKSAQYVICDGLGVARQMFPVLKKNPDLKLVVVVHGFVRFKPKDLVNFIGNPDRVKLVLVSSSLADEINGCYPGLKDLVNIIPNTLDPDFAGDLLPKAEARAELGVPPMSKLYVVASRLSSKKDVATVVRAYAELPLGDHYLVVMGDGPNRQELESLAIELGVGERVIWLGWVKNSSRYLKAFDVFVSGSRSEGFGLSVFEAYTAGLPVVCTDIIPHREALGGRGAYFEKGDVAGCTKKLAEACDNTCDDVLDKKYREFSASYREVISF